MAVLDVDGKNFSIGVDTPLPTATVLVHNNDGDDETSVEMDARQCLHFAHSLVRAAFLLDARLLSYDASEFARKDLHLDD